VTVKKQSLRVKKNVGQWIQAMRVRASEAVSIEKLVGKK
jgi:hypothetical protein